MAYRRAFPGIQRAVRAAVALGGGGGGGPITPSLVASRTSGPAPLVVQFDATGTTAAGVSDPFRQIGYAFDYHDPASGTWATNGLSKNVDRGGPFGGHCFETPGTYVVLMRARAPDGSTAQTSVTITVQDPNSVFAGASTICLSRNSDHSGAPAGATLLSNVTAWPTWESNRRYLLHAGQDWSSLPAIQIGRGLSNIQVARYSTGANPNPQRVIAGHWQGFIDNPVYAENITFVDMACSGDESIGGNIFRHCAWIRCAMGGFLNGVGEGVDFLYNNYASQGGTLTNREFLMWPEYPYVVECYSRDNSVHASLFGAAIGWTVMGCTITRPLQHNIRTYVATKALLQHNALNASGLYAVTHMVKMQGFGDQVPVSGLPFAQNINAATSKAIQRSNVIGLPGNDQAWALQVGPQNPESSEGVEDVIIENCDFTARDWQNEIAYCGRRITMRGNFGINVNPVDATAVYGAGLPGGIGGPWDGPHFVETANIQTSDPVR